MEIVIVCRMKGQGEKKDDQMGWDRWDGTDEGGFLRVPADEEMMGWDGMVSRP